MAKKKTSDVAIIIPDASPIMTLARIDRIDLLEYTSAWLTALGEEGRLPEAPQLIARIRFASKVSHDPL